MNEVDLTVDPIVEVVQELPVSERPQTKFWRLVMEQVTANKPNWCRVPGLFDPSTVTHIRQGRNTSIDPEDVLIETRYEVTEGGRKKAAIFMRAR